MIENHMVVDDLWEFVPRCCKKCDKRIDDCICEIT